MTRRDTIVEFMGVPGAGKSTLAAALAARLAGDYDIDFPHRSDYRRKALPLAEKVRLDVLFAVAALPYRLTRVIHDVRRSGIGLWTLSNSWNRSRYPLLMLDRAARAPREVHVLDEWLIHRTIGESIMRYDADINFTCQFAIPPKAPQRLIYVSVDIDHRLALERVLAQDQPFREFAVIKDRRHIEKVLGLWLAQHQTLKLEIGRRGLPMLSVDGSLPIEDNVALLQDWLNGLRMAPGSEQAATQHARTDNHETHFR